MRVPHVSGRKVRKDPLKGCVFALTGHDWKHNFSLFEGSRKHSSSSHWVTVWKKEIRWFREKMQRGVAKPTTMTAGGGEESPPWQEQQMSGGYRVKGHLPACPNRKVLTQEPEEVRRSVVPHAGVGPVLGCLGKSVVPHLSTQRHGGSVEKHYITGGKWQLYSKQQDVW